MSHPFGRVGAESLELPFEHPDRMVQVGEDFAVDISIINYGSWIKKVLFFLSPTRKKVSPHVQNIVSRCPSDSNVEEVRDL